MLVLPKTSRVLNGLWLGSLSLWNIHLVPRRSGDHFAKYPRRRQNVTQSFTKFKTRHVDGWWFYCIVQFVSWNGKPSQNLVVICLLLSVWLSGVFFRSFQHSCSEQTIVCGFEGHISLLYMEKDTQKYIVVKLRSKTAGHMAIVKVNANDTFYDRKRSSRLRKITPGDAVQWDVYNALVKELQWTTPRAKWFGCCVSWRLVHSA